MSSAFDTQSKQARVDTVAALASVAERKEQKSVAGKIFPILLLAVFFAALLFSLVAGITVYNRVVDVQTATNNERTSLGLVANSVRANDATGCIAVGEGPEGRSLVIVEHLQSGNYETRTYLYQGQILQEYALEGNPYTPAKASLIAQSDTFSFTYENGLLSITTDQGTTEVALRYLQGGE